MFFFVIGAVWGHALVTGTRRKRQRDEFRARETARQREAFERYLECVLVEPRC